MDSLTHCVEIYSPRSGGAFFISATMTLKRAAKLAAEYNALLSPAEMEHTGARVVLRPERAQGRPWKADEPTQGQGYRSRVE